MASSTRATASEIKIRRAAGRGMTLVELLITIPILVIIGIIVVSLFMNYIHLFIANNDIVVAGQRADMVFRLLEEPILHAGLGLDSRDPDEYRENWDSDDGSHGHNDGRDEEEYEGIPSNDLPFPAYWEGYVVPEFNEDVDTDLDGDSKTHMDAVIFLGDKDEKNYYPEIRILYAVPTGLKIENLSDLSDDVTSPDVDHVITLLDHNLPDECPFPDDSPRTDIRSWLTVPGTHDTEPMLLMPPHEWTNTNHRLHVAVFGDDDVPELLHQELYQMKAVRAYVDGEDHFHLEEFTNGEETASIATVDGVRGVRFKMSDEPGSIRKFIEVRVLVTGDSHDANHAQTIWARLDERWDELTGAEDAGIYFEEFVIKWRVRNLGERFED